MRLIGDIYTPMTNCDESVVERRVVMADVAKLAKVFSQTVSRVLFGKGTVRPEAVRRVWNAIEYLGYQPSIAAQMLVSGTSKAIGMLTIGNLSYDRMQAFSAFERLARANGHYVMPATFTSYEIDDLIEAIHYFRQARIRSLVIIGQRVEFLNRLNFIVVSVWPPLDHDM